MVSVSVLLPPPAAAVIMAVAVVLVRDVFIVNGPVAMPLGTFIVGEVNLARGFELDKVITTPAGPAGASSTTLPSVEFPPRTGFGNIVTEIG